jgi:hypothetical protein
MDVPRQYRGGDFQKVNAMLQGNNKIIYPKLLTNKQASHIHKGLIISMVMDIYKPLSWSHIAHPIAATEE